MRRRMLCALLAVLTLLGLAAAVLCYALSVLILQAAEMKEEADLTI